VDNKCTSHKYIIRANCVPKIIKVGGNLMKLWQKHFAQFFGTRYSVSQCKLRLTEAPTSAWLGNNFTLFHIRKINQTTTTISKKQYQIGTGHTTITRR